jgi:hypothetical protein
MLHAGLRYATAHPSHGIKLQIQFCRREKEQKRGRIYISEGKGRKSTLLLLDADFQTISTNFPAYILSMQMYCKRAGINSCVYHICHNTITIFHIAFLLFKGTVSGPTLAGKAACLSFYYFTCSVVLFIINSGFWPH